jgi:hypothetical protein
MVGKKHLGFEETARKIARRQHIPIANARAILAVGARKASASARKANPRLNRVRSKKRGR